MCSHQWLSVVLHFSWCILILSVVHASVHCDHCLAGQSITVSLLTYPILHPPYHPSPFHLILSYQWMTRHITSYHVSDVILLLDLTSLQPPKWYPTPHCPDMTYSLLTAPPLLPVPSHYSWPTPSHPSCHTSSNRLPTHLSLSSLHSLIRLALLPPSTYRTAPCRL